MSFSKNPLIISLVSVSIALSACGQVTPTVSTAASPIDTATLPPTATSLPLPTANLLQEANIVEKCPAILPSTDLSEIKAGGVVVLIKSRHPHDLYLDDIREAYLFNLASNQLLEFSQQGENLSYYGMAVSPDRKTLAYSVGTPKDETIKLVLSNSIGERQKIIPIKSDIPYPMYGNFSNWLNDQELILDGDVFNPYTGEKQSFNPEEFPDISPDDLGIYSLDFDSELTRVIYTSFGANIAMTDLATMQVLAEIPDHYTRPPEVAWSPNDGLVAMLGASRIQQDDVDDEIFLVDRDGKEIRQVTHLSTYYGTQYELFNLSWSPNGKHIAFWQNDHSRKTKGLRLFVLDTETEELTSYCTWGKPTNITFYGSIWSPDGTQLLIGDLSIQDKVCAVILDIDKNVAVPIADDAIPVGWMLEP